MTTKMSDPPAIVSRFDRKQRTWYVFSRKNKISFEDGIVVITQRASGIDQENSRFFPDEIPCVIKCLYDIYVENK